MRVKTYQAGEIADALNQVRQDLGPDAVILSTQRIEANTGEFAGPIVEVMAGLSRDLSQTGMHFFQHNSPGVPNVKLREPVFGYDRPTSMKIELDQLLGPEIDEIVDLLDDDLIDDIEDRASQELDPAVLAILNEQLGVTTATAAAIPSAPDTAELMAMSREEPGTAAPRVSPPPVPSRAARHQGAGAYRRGGHSQSFVRTPSGVHRGLADQAQTLSRDPVSELEHWLLDADLAPVHQTTLMASVRSRLGGLRPSRDAVESGFVAELVKRVQIRPEEALDARRIVALVGPTGVGKTTTVAKLAADYTMRKHRSVGLLTIDTYRIGAVEQLSRYAGLLEIPLEVVTDRASLERSLRRLEHCDMVLVDTIGRSPRAARPAQELGALFEGIPGVSYELCVSATTSLRDMRGTLESYAEIRPENLLYTKLDETFAPGPMLSAHLEDTLPLSYFTTGQRVPEDIEQSSVERIAGMMIPFE